MADHMPSKTRECRGRALRRFFARLRRCLLAPSLAGSLLLCGFSGPVDSLAAPEGASTANLQVNLATYLASASGAQMNAVDVAPDGTVVVAGRLARDGGETSDTAQFGVSPTSLLGGGEGVVIRLAAAPSAAPQALSVTRIGAAVEDLRLNAGGTMVVCGGFGVALLDASANSILWAANPGAGRRCAIGEDGTVAVLSGSNVYVYSAAGSPLGNWAAGGSGQNDLAIDAAHGLVIATGYSNRRTSLAPTATPVQIAFLKAWSYTGATRWSDYDFAPESLGTLVADTRGERVSLGRDGKLYFAGESAGGSSIFLQSPASVRESLSDDQVVSGDAFNTPYNTKSNQITWLGRYNPADGTLERGEFILARVDNGRGNTIRPRAIMADETGRVYVAGTTTASIQNRDAKLISGMPVGPYAGSEAFLLVLQADLRRRLVWTTFTAASPAGPDTTHESAATAVSVRNGVGALTAGLAHGALLTYNPVQSLPGTLPAGYLAVWPQTGEPADASS